MSSSSSPSSPSETLNSELSTKTPPFGLRLWVVIGISVCILLLLVLAFLCTWALFRRKKSPKSFSPIPLSLIPDVSKEISVDQVRHAPAPVQSHPATCPPSEKTNLADNMSQCSSAYHVGSGDESGSGPKQQQNYQYALVSASPLVGLPEFSHLGWGHWFTLRDLEHASNRFSKENVIGEGGYGIVYCGRLINGTDVAIKKLLNNL